MAEGEGDAKMGEMAGSVMEQEAQQQQQVEKEEEAAAQVVTPWEVEAKEGGKINYDKLIVDFGCSKIDASIVSRVEHLTQRPVHPFLRRNVFFAHRYLVNWKPVVVVTMTI